MKLSKFRKRYKAIIFDVDGTLIPNKIDGLPSKKVVQYILKANKILHIGVATSRPHSLLSRIAKRLKLFGPSIIHSGARVIDIASQKILWEQTIDEKSIKKLYGIFRKHNLNASINDDGNDIKFSKNYTPKKPLTGWVLAVTPNVANILVKEISEIPNLIAHKLPSWSGGDNISVSFTHSFATKKHALLETAKILKIETSEIIGVGDGHNDLPLLAPCGLKIAMGNADSELKAIADYVAPSVENDGVADIIEKFVLNKL